MHRLPFWLAVAGVALLANFAAEQIGLHTAAPGYQRFLDILHGRKR